MMLQREVIEGVRGLIDEVLVSFEVSLSDAQRLVGATIERREVVNLVRSLIELDFMDESIKNCYPEEGE